MKIENKREQIVTEAANKWSICAARFPQLSTVIESIF